MLSLHFAIVLFVVGGLLVIVVGSLRTKSRESAYSGSFIEHWLQRLMYFDAPPWVFAIAYSLFGLVVLAAWWYFPPRSRRGGRRDEA